MGGDTTMSELTQKDIDDRVMYGPMDSVGPVIKASQKEKTIHVIYRGNKIQNFIHESHISKHDPTMEGIVNALNHFFNEYENHHYEEKLVDCSHKINSEIRNALVMDSFKSEDTDINRITELTVRLLAEYLEDHDMIKDIKDYVDNYSYYEVSMFKSAKENYEASLDADGIKIACMLTVLAKMMFLIMTKCINPTRIYRPSINIKNLEMKIRVRIFETLYESCAFIYSNNTQHLKGFKYDFYDNFIVYFMDKGSKTIDENSDHILTKHALLGTTESTIYSSLYDQFIETLIKQRLNFLYRPDLIKMKPENFVKQYCREQAIILHGDSIIYYPDRKYFGFNFASFIKYRTNALKNHLDNSSIAKKEKAILAIAELSDGEGLSRIDKIFRSMDIQNKEKSRINNAIKHEFIDRIREGINKSILGRVKENKVTKNVYNTTILPMYLEYLGVNIGNPLSYMNTHEFTEFIAYTYNWSLLKKIGNGVLAEMLLCNKEETPVMLDIAGIDNYINEKFGSYNNKYLIKDKVLNVCNTKWSSGAGLTSSITLDPNILVDFFYMIYEIKLRSINERA